jgi:hypothetical protein
MGWIKNELKNTEEVIFTTRPHWSVFLLPLMMLSASMLIWWIVIPALILLSYDAFIFISHQIVVTNHRLIQKKGIYYIRTKNWPLQKIEEVICSRTIADRLMGSGSVILMGISISKLYLRGVGNPKELRNAIYSQLPMR